MNKPLICFDIEATGPDPASDRIIQIAGKCIETGFEINWMVNPGFPIPAESTAIHGICDADVAACPTFNHYAQSLHDWMKDADLVGFNLTNFDVPILWEEFYRCGIVWDLSNTRILDAGTLFKKREQRTLSAALQFYCGRDHNGAHDALGDVIATLDVWEAQLGRYGLADKDREELEIESNFEEKRVDLAGKIVIGKDGRPAYNIGRAKGTAVEDDRGFGYWMLDRDFSENTKIHLRRLLETSNEPSELF